MASKGIGSTGHFHAAQAIDHVWTGSTTSAPELQLGLHIAALLLQDVKLPCGRTPGELLRVQRLLQLLVADLQLLHLVLPARSKLITQLLQVYWRCSQMHKC